MDKLTDFSTKEGYQINLPTHTTASNAANTFNLDLPETQNLDITKMMSLWVKYMENVGNGTFNPNPLMVKNRKLDYTSSLFYFVFEPDGRTLKYWVKFTGCFPTEIPSSSLGYQKGSSDAVTVSIPFQYNVKEEMNPDILKEFNMISLNLLGRDHFKNDITDNHTSFKESKYLTTSGIDEITGITDFIKAPDRDPLILLTEGTTDGLLKDSRTSTKLQLLFAHNTNERSFAKKTFGDDYLVSLSLFDTAQ